MNKTMSPTRTALSGLVLAAGLAFGTQAAAAAAAPPPVQAFFGPISMTLPLLSPSGGYIAVLANTPGANHRRLLVIDANDLHKIKVVAAFGDADVVNVHWVNDERLVFEVGDERESAFLSTHGGLFAVDRTGEDLRTLISLQVQDSTGTRIKSRILDPDNWFMQTLRDGSDDVVIGKSVYANDELVSVTPMRLDTRTQNVRHLFTTAAPDFATEWALDDHARPLAAITSQGSRRHLLVPDGDHWKSVNEFDRFGVVVDGLSFVDVSADGNVYVAAGEANAEQTTALYKLDLRTGKAVDRALVSVKGFDFAGLLVPDLKTHKLAGVHYFNDAYGSVWFEPELVALQATIDAKLPGTINTLQPAECGCSTKVVITAASDHQPEAFFLYDTATKTLSGFGGIRPDIDARAMADTDFFRFNARDGLDIPVYVTKPAGKGPFPSVVLVHGGPMLRGRYWGFSPQAQFLASRGYAVIEPEFRGSTGYGSRLTSSGFKQWGLAMDNDLVDTARWAANKGISDPKRVCVMGESYGGYATLMALIKDPDVFRCGIAGSAVTDLSLLYDLQWSDLGNDSRAYDLPLTLGDRVKDAAQFDATSPLKLAARLKQPLLLEHGGVDRRVPVEHAERLRSALLSAGKTNLEWVRYDEEGHGLSKPENNYDFYTRVEKFLDAQIGPGSVGKPAQTAAQ